MEICKYVRATFVDFSCQQYVEYECRDFIFAIGNCSGKFDKLWNLYKYCQFFLRDFLSPNYSNISHSHTTHISVLLFFDVAAVVFCLDRDGDESYSKSNKPFQESK